MRRLILGTAVIGGVAFATVPVVSASDFNPVRNLTTWYTDRTPIDIEIVSSPDPTTGADNFDSKRTLRIRVERAFVQMLLARRTTFVHFGLDMETGIASSRFSATSNDGRSRESFPDVPEIPPQERLTRLLNLTIASDHSARSLQRISARLQKCAGKPIESDLLSYEVSDQNGCRRSSYPNGSRYIAKFDGDLLLQVECQKPSFPGTGCHLNFPFEGFAVRVSFHRNHLARWRDVVDRAASFLKSNEYRADENRRERL
jgi:hypothetical protein